VTNNYRPASEEAQELRKEQETEIVSKETDERGRITLGSKYKNREVTVKIIDH